MDAARSNAQALQTPGHVNKMGREGSTPGHCKISVSYLRLNSPVLIGGTNISPTRTGRWDIVIPHRSTGFMEVGNTQIFNTSINENLTKDGDSTPIFSKVIVQELSNDSSADIYLYCRVDFMSNSFQTEAPDFMHLGLLAVNALDELRSFGTPATRVGNPTDGLNWSAPSHVFR